MHDDIDRAGVHIDEQHSRPRLSAVGRAIESSVLLRAVAVPLRCDEDDVRVVRIDHDAADAPAGVETRVRPCATGISRLEYSGAHRDVAANPRLAGAGPDDIGAVSYTHLRAHETPEHLVCRLLL